MEILVQKINIDGIIERAANGLYRSDAYDFGDDSINLLQTTDFTTCNVAPDLLDHVNSIQARAIDMSVDDEVLELALDYTFYRLARAGGYLGIHGIFHENDNTDIAACGYEHLHDIRESIADSDIHLSGPIGTSVVYVERARARASKVIEEAVVHSTLVIPAGVSTEDFVRSFLRTAGQFGTLLYRLETQYATSGALQALLKHIPELLEEYVQVTSILGLTNTHLRATRHPVLALTPQITSELVKEALGMGFTMSQIRTMAGHAKTEHKFNSVKDTLNLLMKEAKIPLNLAREISVDRADPRIAARDIAKAITKLSTLYAANPEVRYHDIKNIVRNHGVKNAEAEIEAYICRVISLREKYAGDPLVNSDLIRTAARRSKNPESYIETVRERYFMLTLALPDVSIKLLLHAAVNFTDPLTHLQNALARYTVDPTMGTGTVRPVTAALWEMIQASKSTANN